MKKSEIELAKAALRVLPENGSADFEQWYQTVGPVDEAIEASEASSQCVIVNYDLAREKQVSLPPTLHRFETLVNDYLLKTSSTDPWGMLSDEVVVLKLSDQPTSKSGRLLLFKTVFITTLLHRLFPNEKITPAEQKTVLQTLSGLTLKEASVLDGVSYETKKSQLKSVFQKTQINRQQVLSSFLIAHLTLEVAASYSRKPTDHDTDEQFFYYVDHFMGDYVRASVIQEAPGQRFRIIEIGDPGGRPIVGIHHLGILNFSKDDIERIRRQGIRLICPLRQGALGPIDNRVSLEEHWAHALAGIDIAASLVPDRKVTILSMLSGCYYSIRYLQDNPDKVQNLILVSASYRPQEAKWSRLAFKRNLHSLAGKNQTLFSTAVSFLISRAENPDQLRKVWRDSLNGCEADHEQVEAVYADPEQVAAMQHRLKHSPVSIVRDLEIQAEADWSPLNSPPAGVSIHFIHGDADTVIPIDTVRLLTDQYTEFSLHPIAGAGNWAFGEFIDPVYSTVKRIVDTNADAEVF